MEGILFKPDMVKAIVEGRKTVTRQLDGLKKINQEPDKWHLLSEWGLGWFEKLDGQASYKVCIEPRYHVGEVAYIKEAWWSEGGDIYYKSDWLNVLPVNMFYAGMKEGKWRSPLFMPAWSARLFLKITEVQAERVFLPLPSEELEYEGGEQAMPMLEKLDGKWVWVYSFKRVERQEFSLVVNPAEPRG